VVRNPLQRLGKGWRAPLMGIGCGATGPLSLGGASPAEGLGSRATLLGGPASSLGRGPLLVKGQPRLFLTPRKRVIKNESPAPVGQASFGKEEPRRGAARKAITLRNRQPRYPGAGEEKAPA
jgi:hypothetical protein